MAPSFGVSLPFVFIVTVGIFGVAFGTGGYAPPPHQPYQPPYAPTPSHYGGPHYSPPSGGHQHGYMPPSPQYHGGSSSNRYKREPADYYTDKPGYDKPTKSSSSSSGDYSGGYGGKGIHVDTSLYWVPSTFTEYVIDLKGKDGGSYEASVPWKADCNAAPYGYKFGWLTAFWDDYEFKDLDYLKCAGPKGGDDYDKYGGYKLDTYDAKVIEFGYSSSSYKPPSGDYKPPSGDYKPPAYGDKPSYSSVSECYKGYLLTALWAGDYDFKSVKYGKCVRLVSGLVDYSTCDNISTDYKQGGTYEAYKRWNVECPHEWAAVGLKKGEYDKIEYVRCCKLIPPHPTYKY